MVSAVQRKDEAMSNHTPGPWELHGDEGILEIWAPVDIGPDMIGQPVRSLYEVSLTPHLKVLDNGTVQACITYQQWLQFSTPDIRATQQANGELIAKAPDMLAELRKLRAENAQLREQLERAHKSTSYQRWLKSQGGKR